jgi:hypothetical protein
MPACIYCTTHEADSEEHDIPYGLGRFKNHALLSERLCEDCNSRRLSKLDGRVCRRGPEGYFRMVVGVRGRAQNEKKSPFYGRDYGAGPIRMLAILPEAPEDDYEILWEFVPDSGSPPQIRELRQVIVRDADGKIYPIAVDDWLTTPDQLTGILRELGLSDAKLDRLIATPEEQPRLEGLTAALPRPAGTQISWSAPEPTPRSIATTTEVIYDELYWRGITKIAFHYALKAFPMLSGMEAGFAPVKTYISEGGDSRRFVIPRFDDPRTRAGIFRRSPRRFMHVIYADKRTRRLKVEMRLFWGPEYDPPTYQVDLGEHGLTIAHQDRVGDHFVFYHPEPREQNFDGFVDPIVFPAF